MPVKWEDGQFSHIPGVWNLIGARWFNFQRDGLGLGRVIAPERQCWVPGGEAMQHVADEICLRG